MRTRARSLLLLALLWGWALPSPPPAYGRQAPGRGRPNIVFIISDDHRWDALGAAGNPQIRTPALDRMAREGVFSGRRPSTVLGDRRNHGIGYAVSEWADTESQFRDYTHRLVRTPRYKLIRWDKTAPRRTCAP